MPNVTDADIQGAIAYNRTRRAAGQMNDEDEAMLVAMFQEYAPEELVAPSLPPGTELQVDGKLGPMSRGALRQLFRVYARQTPPDEAPPAPVAVGAMSPFATALMDICAAEEGHGEELFDNSGPHIVRYRGLPSSYATRNLGAWHHWCSFSAGYMVRQAYAKIGRPDDGLFMMFRDDNFGGKMMPIGGARDLVLRGGKSKHGKFIAREGKLLEALMPGDLVAIRYNGDMNERRGPGHVFIVRTAAGELGRIITTWEGNLGPFPALWKSRKRDVLALGGSAKLLQACRLS